MTDAMQMLNPDKKEKDKKGRTPDMNAGRNMPRICKTKENKSDQKGK